MLDCNHLPLSFLATSTVAQLVSIYEHPLPRTKSLGQFGTAQRVPLYATMVDEVDTCLAGGQPENSKVVANEGRWNLR